MNVSLFRLKVCVTHMITHRLKFICCRFLGRGPEGDDDLCFHTYGGFFPSAYSPLTQILASRPKSQPWGHCNDIMHPCKETSLGSSDVTFPSLMLTKIQSDCAILRKIFRCHGMEEEPNYMMMPSCNIIWTGGHVRVPKPLLRHQRINHFPRWNTRLITHHTAVFKSIWKLIIRIQVIQYKL